MFPGPELLVPQEVESSEPAQPQVRLSCLDTTAASVFHRLAFRYLCSRATGAPSSVKICVASIALTYLPLFLAALMSGLPMVRRTAQLHLPFLYDWNVGFMFLASFPTLMALTIRDQVVLVSSLKQVQTDGVLLVADDVESALCSKWKRRFRALNIAAQITGVILGAILAVANYLTYRPPSVGFWIAVHGDLLPVGYVYLWCIFLFYVLIPIYALRNIEISMFLKDLVAHSEISELPFHPDQSGGLRPVGEIGLRNQYGLTVAGLNIVILIFVSFLYLTVPPALYRLIAAAALAYIVLGPVVFVGPLLPFRAGMLRTKTMLMSEVAQRLRIELHRLRQQLQSGDITREDEELVDRLRKLGSVIDQLPVWPFNSGTLRKFLSAYVTPLLGAGLVRPVLMALLSAVKH